MGRMRDAIRLGDPTTSHGYVVTASGQMSAHGKTVAAIGDMAYCDACKSSGPIMALNYVAFNLPNGQQVALEDDWVDCHCHEKPRLIATLRGQFQVEDDRGPMPPAMAKRVAPEASPVVMAVSPELEVTDSNRSDICPGMDKANFCHNMLSLRDDAVVLIQRRLAAMGQWDQTEQTRFMTWFGTTEEAAKSQIQTGLTQMLKVMQDMNCASFVKYSVENLRASTECGLGDHGPNLVAAVCASDTGHTIFMTEKFCSLRRYSQNLDSQVMTLIHEVSHFKDVMETQDIVYTMYRSKERAQQNPREALINADNVSSYIVSE